MTRGMTEDDQPDDDGDRSDDVPSGERTPGEIGPGGTASDPPSGASREGGEHESDESFPRGDRRERVPDEDRDEPLSDLREDVSERRERTGDDDVEGLFSEVSVGDVDEDAVWEELSESADEPAFVTESVEADREVTVVDKSLCHGCEYFADPPDTACTHDGTDIEAEVDTDHFRVVDCPIVEERREREASDFSADDI